MDKTESLTAASYIASLSGMVTSLTLNETIALSHLLLAVGTFCLNWAYKRRYYHLAVHKTDIPPPKEDRGI